MRVNNWAEILTDYLVSEGETAFVWGINDCCRFAGRVAALMTGEDHTQAYECNSAREAKALLEVLGGVANIADEFYPRLPVGLAQRGDIVEAVVNETGETALGICNGEDAVFKAGEGLLRLPMNHVIRAWGVR